MEHPAKVTHARILDTLADYQNKSADQAFIVLSFSGFSKEVSLIFQDLVLLGDETLCFKGVDLTDGFPIEVVQNHLLVNFVTSYVESTHSVAKKLDKLVIIENLIAEHFP